MNRTPNVVKTYRLDLGGEEGTDCIIRFNNSMRHCLRDSFTRQRAGHSDHLSKANIQSAKVTQMIVGIPGILTLQFQRLI
jgi:hypothetical protein